MTAGENPVERYVWSRLNNQQVGAYTEYFVKMELTMYGFQVYGTEVDDRGIDFVARHENGPFIEVQVKSLRTQSSGPSGYVFMGKKKFTPCPGLFLALGLLFEKRPPDLYLIPSAVWLEPAGIFVSHDYENLKSLPEWGINVSKKNMPALDQYRFGITVATLIEEAVNKSLEQTSLHGATQRWPMP